MNILRILRGETFLDELLALFSCEHRVLGGLRLVQCYDDWMELVDVIVGNPDLLQATLPR